MSVAAALADLDVDERVRERLVRYADLLLSRNATLNLTAARDAESVAEHVRDSLSIASYVREPLVDVGSGGGFPAIPLAIATGVGTTLVESVVKKARFLTDVVAALELPVTVRAARAEDVARDPATRESFASATARAVANVPTVLELLVPLLAVGGVAILQRGELDAAERTAAADAALVLGAEVVDEIELPRVAGDRRRVLLVRKRLPTGPRFPRRAGIPAKRPLCWEGRGG